LYKGSSDLFNLLPLEIDPLKTLKRIFMGSAWLFNYQKSKKKRPNANRGAVIYDSTAAIAVGYNN